MAIAPILTAFQRNAFQNNAFQIGGDFADGGSDGDKVRKKAWRLEDLYNFSQKNASPEDKRKLDEIVKPFERPAPQGKKIEFEELASHKIARQQVTNYIRELYDTRQELKERLLRLINIEFLKQKLEVERIQEENFFIFLLLLEE